MGEPHSDDPFLNLSYLKQTLNVPTNFLTGFFVQNRHLLWHWHLSSWHWSVLVYPWPLGTWTLKPLSSEFWPQSHQVNFRNKGITLCFGIQIIELYCLNSLSKYVSSPRTLLAESWLENQTSAELNSWKIPERHFLSQRNVEPLRKEVMARASFSEVSSLCELPPLFTYF